MTPTELAEVREALWRVNLRDQSDPAWVMCRPGDTIYLSAIGAFTDFLMRRPQGFAGSIEDGQCIVCYGISDVPAIVHPNPLVALARAVNATEETP